MFSAQVTCASKEVRVELTDDDWKKIRRIFDNPMREYFVNFTPNRRGALIEVYCVQDEDDPSRLARIMRMGWTWRLRNGLAAEFTHEEYERRFGRFVRRRIPEDVRMFNEGRERLIRNRFKARVCAVHNLANTQASRHAVIENEEAYK